MNCENCGTDLRMMTGVAGFYRYCPGCGETYNIEKPAEAAV
jgi:predicted RNA-binding Zn-ribbon protein involved in translation (DUF1610 family)